MRWYSDAVDNVNEVGMDHGNRVSTGGFLKAQ